MKYFHPPGCYQVFYRLAILTKHAPEKFALINSALIFNFPYIAFEEVLQHPDLKIDLGLCAVHLAMEYKRYMNTSYDRNVEHNVKIRQRHLRPETYQCCALWVTYSSYLFCQRSNAYQKAL